MEYIQYLILMKKILTHL